LGDQRQVSAALVEGGKDKGKGRDTDISR